MRKSLINRLRFFLERQFVRGTPFQLLVMAFFVGMISLLGGLLAFGTGEANESILDAIWWAFLRLTDPGYLGDDEGIWRRIVSTLLTISGYVVFMGALIAILTQWLGGQIRSLERGFTPVHLKHHIVVLGWTESTLPLLRELWMAEGGVKRFLFRLGVKSRMRIVVLAEDLQPHLAEELRTDPILGKHFNDIILRSGSALNNEHLQRTACLQAAAIIVPAKSFNQDSSISSDVESIKVLLALNGLASASQSHLPYVVAEIQSPHKVEIARRAYQGPIEVISGDQTISRLMVQNIRHPGLSTIYVELFSHQLGQSFYLHKDPALAGKPVGSIRGSFKQACFCGLIRQHNGHFIPLLNPAADLLIEADDALLLLAADYQQAQQRFPVQADMVSAGKPAEVPSVIGAQQKNILIAGWSRKVPAILHEFATYTQDRYQITIMSSRPVAEREAILKSEGVNSPAISLSHIVAEVTNEMEWRNLELAAYDSIVLMSSDRLGSGEEADARSIVGYLHLESVLQKSGKQPQLLLEFSDPNNERLLGHRAGEVIISPLMLSHLLVHVALRRELLVAVDDLFSAGGPEINFRHLADYRLQAGSHAFSDIRQTAWDKGETALGIYFAGALHIDKTKVLLNPAAEEHLNLTHDDLIVVLESYPGNAYSV
jgi:hypothetical protein